MTCQECGQREATKTTLSARRLCPECYQRLIGITAGVSSYVSGESAATAVGTGLGAAGSIGAVEAEAAAAKRRGAELAATTGFWRRLRKRIVG